VIHQERQVAPALSGLEHLFLGVPYPRRRGGLVDWTAMRGEAARLQSALGIHVPLHLPARRMSPAEQTWLEILRAALTASTVLLLDEPTAALTGHAADQLFALMRRLRAQGTIIVYVSHRLDEVRAIADRVTVLRNGRWAGEVTAAEATTEGLVAMITGRPAAGTTSERARPSATAATLLEARDLVTRDGRVRGASLTLRAGEVVGLFGLAGAGRTETIEAIYGLRPMVSGDVAVRGARMRRLSPGRALRAGAAMVPEDRRTAGLIPRHSVRENMTLSMVDRYRRWGLIQGRAEIRAVRGQIEALRIRTEGPGQHVDQLSGGNQQKVMLARALLAEPAILLCDEPTHAVDVGARQTIHAVLHARARAGCAVLFSSSDLAEVMAVAGRIVVMANGRTVGAVDADAYDPEAIMRLCYRATEGTPGGGP